MIKYINSSLSTSGLLSLKVGLISVATSLLMARSLQDFEQLVFLDIQSIGSVTYTNILDNKRSVRSF